MKKAEPPAPNNRQKPASMDRVCVIVKKIHWKEAAALTKSKAFILFEVFFLLLGIALLILSATGFLITDRHVLFGVLGVVISVVASLRIIAGLRSLKMESRGRS